MLQQLLAHAPCRTVSVDGVAVVAAAVPYVAREVGSMFAASSSGKVAVTAAAPAAKVRKRLRVTFISNLKRLSTLDDIYTVKVVYVA